jgi:isoleucyl-tRNA synthetase
MSKSLGNVISPLDVAGSRGAEILRLWVSMIDFLEDMRLSEEILDRNAEAYRKIRNTFRYLLGNLEGFDAGADAVPYGELEPLDRWALHQFEGFRRRVVEAYAAHQYHLVYHEMNRFCTVTLSSVYLDILKDRLYTAPKRSRERRAAQTVLWRLASGMARLTAPILCFTSEEVWQELEGLSGRERWGTSTVHAQVFPEADALPEDRDLVERFDRLFVVREEIYRALEQARAAKRIGSALDAKVRIGAPREVVGLLSSFGADLRFLLIVSGFELLEAPEMTVEVLPADGTKCERCRNWTEDVGRDAEFPTICARCAAAVRA